MKTPVMVLQTTSTHGPAALMVATAERFLTAPELDAIAERLTEMLNAETPKPEEYRPDHVEIITTLDYYKYSIAVKIDGVIRSTIPATPGQVVKFRNEIAEYWTQHANTVDAAPIPEIATLRKAGDRQ